MTVQYKKVSAYDAAGSLSGAESLTVVQAGVTKRTTTAAIANTADTLGDVVTGSIDPSADGSKNLGSLAYRWSQAFFKSSAVLTWGDSDYTLTHSTDLLTLSGALKAGGALTTTSATAGLGYATGAGGTVTQATSKSTGVTLNKTCGTITLNAASLASATTVGFTLTDSAIGADDIVVVNIKSGATANAYSLTVGAKAAGSCLIELRNNTGGALAEAVVLSFAVIKAVAA